MNRIEFKFIETSPASERSRTLLLTEKLSSQQPSALFPDEDDPELASLYKVEDVKDRDVSTLLELLESQACIEFAESQNMRRLIH